MAARLSGGGGALTYFLAAAGLIFIVSPLVVVVALSFSEASIATYPPVGFTTAWYQRVIVDDEFRQAFLTSVTLALASTVASFVLGLPAAYALNRWEVPGARTIETILLSPFILPILITGLALLQFMALLRMRDALTNLFIGHVLITLPYLVRTVTASLKQVDRSLEEAALTLGASPWRVFWRVTAPQITPGIAAGCLFAFMVSFDDFPISFWLSNAENMPLPIYLQNSMTKVFDPSIATMSSFTIMTGILAVIGLEKLVGLRRAMSV
ncbi:MAG: ABC transporter permease [Proteobacteria bacterium]|nr:ABC transporter permease [Pseudomonadota bacterium]